MRSEFPKKSFWERQWVVFDGDFDGGFADRALQVLCPQATPFLRREKDLRSRFQFLLWNEGQLLRKELFSALGGAPNLDLEWEEGTYTLGSEEPQTSESRTTQATAARKLRKLERTRFFFETRSLAGLSPASLARVKIVHVGAPVFTCEDLVRAQFKRLSLVAEQKGQTRLANMFASGDYAAKVVALVKDIRDQVVKKAGLKPRFLFKVKVQDALAIFEHLMRRVMTDRAGGPGGWRGGLTRRPQAHQPAAGLRALLGTGRAPEGAAEGEPFQRGPHQNAAVLHQRLFGLQLALRVLLRLQGADARSLGRAGEQPPLRWT